MSRKARAKHLAASASASASSVSASSAPADEYDSSCGFGVRYFACSLGYCPVKDTCASCSSALLLLAPSGSEGLSSANVWNVEAFKTLRAVASALASLAAAAAEGQSDVPTDVCIVDAAPLAAPKDMAAELEAEAGATVLGKRLGKPVARAVEKLSTSGAAMIAAGAACTLLLKLMRGDQARTPNASRLVLLHPQVSKVCERLMLAPDWRKAYGRNAPANVPVDVVFQDEASRSHLEPLLRGAYPDGRTAVCGDGEAAVLLARAFAAAVSDEPDALDGAHITSSPPAWDPDTYDLLGRSVWLASLSIEMDRTTKQYTPMAEDVTIDVFNSGVMEEEAAEAAAAAAAAAATVAATKPNAPPAPEPPAPSKAATNSRDDEAIRPATTEHPASSSAKHCVGGLVLRGNRCVLVRSLSKAPLWQGMVLPAMPFALGTDPVERARESVSTFCDVDGDSELVPLSPNVPPVALYHAPGCRTDVYFFYARHPPPPGPLEDADMEDDEDYYDWYTFPNAIAAVQRGKEAYASAAVACLEAAAMTLRNAHVAGILEHKYGGIFGQEFLTGGIRSQPQKKLEVPVATKPTVAKLPAAKTPAAKTLAKTKKLRTVPVTLLSGFLGAGKTTLLKRILEQTHAQDTVRVAVLVNDMAAVNIDANLVRNTKMLQREEKLVELHNGCICCTLREDLVKALADLVAEDRFDAIVVESTGVSDPIEVAETFTMEMEDGGANPSAEWLVEIKPIVDALRGKGSLNELAKLDTCVTLVDVAGFDTDMGTSADLTERFRGSADEGDERSVAPLLMSQIEFADVIVLSKCDLVTEEKAVEVERAVRALNAEARVIRAKHGDVALSEVLRTGLFDMRKTSRAAGWLKTMLMESSGEKAAHVSETEEYGISSFVYKARTPFHPVRLMSFLEDHFVVKHEDSSAAEEKGGEKEADLAKRESDAKTKSARMRKRFGNILRSKGFMWLAGRDDQIGEWSQAGAVGQFGCGGPWMSCQPEEAWPAKDSEEYAMIMKDYAGAVLKDRRQEVVIIGQNLDQSAIEHALDACLVTAKECGLVEEASSSSKEDAWKLGLKLDMARDPFPPWPEYDPSAEHDHHDQQHDQKQDIQKGDTQLLPPVPFQVGAWSPFAAAAAVAEAPAPFQPGAWSPFAAAAVADIPTAKTQTLRTVPVTLLSGFLGAGKTTLLKRILEQTHAQDTVRVAVLVNDMAAVNIDANLVRNTKMLQREEKLVELHNGCICCTLREDLVKALADLVAEDRFDAIVVESTGVSDPIEVAETFTMEMEDGGANPSAEWLVEIKPIVDALRGKGSLNELAKLDTCVTLVDVAGFDTDMGTSADLTERFRGSADEGDERSVAPLLMSQIEFADVIVLSKCDLVTEEKAVEVERAVRALNAEARVIRAKHGDVALSEVLRTGLFDMRKTSRAAGWLKTMLMESSGEKAAHVSETEEYGISSFVYKARTPFHPVRLMSFLEDHFVVKHEDSSAAEEKGGEKEADLAKRESDAKTKSARMRKRFGNILRSKGFMWLAGRDDQIGEWSQAGAVGQFGCGGPWMSCQPEEAWPAKDSEEYAMIMKDYAGAVLKDRRQEVVIIGQNLDQSAIEHALDACLVTAKECGLVEEASSSSKEDAWKLGLKLDMARDPFPPWPEYDPSADH